MTSDITQIGSQVQSITEHSQKQKTAIEQAATGIESISGVVQTSAATSQQSAAASEELFSQADIMKQLVGAFRIHIDYR